MPSTRLARTAEPTSLDTLSSLWPTEKPSGARSLSWPSRNPEISESSAEYEVNMPLSTAPTWGAEHGPVVVVLSHSLVVAVVVMSSMSSSVAVVVVAVIVMVGHLAGGAGLQRPDLLFQRPDARLVLLPQRRDLDGKDGGHRRIVVGLGLCRRRRQGDRHRRGRSRHGSRGKEHLVAHVTTPSLVVEVARRKGSRYEIL